MGQEHNMAKKSAFDEALDLVNKVRNRATGAIRSVGNTIGQTALNLEKQHPLYGQLQAGIRQTVAPVLRNFVPQETVNRYQSFSQPNKSGIAGGIAKAVGGTLPYVPLTVATSGFVNPITSRIASTIPKGVNLGTRVLSSAAKGAVNLAPYGAFEGLKYAPTPQERLQNVGKGVAGAAAIGAGFGAAGGAVGYGAQAAMRKVSDSVRRIFPTASEQQISTISKKFVRDELGRFMNLPKGGKKRIEEGVRVSVGKGGAEPVYYGDLRESLGLPRTGNYKEGSISWGTGEKQLQPKGQTRMVSPQITKQTPQAQVSAPQGNVPGGPPDVPPTPSQNLSSKYAFNINKNRLQLSTSERKTLDTTVNIAKPELEKIKGKVLSNDEVIKAAKTSEILAQVTTREQTLQAEAAVLAARQRLTTLDKDVTNLAKGGNTPQLQAQMKDLIESIKVISGNAADAGRKLQSLSIQAGDESIRVQILKEIAKTNKSTDDILREAANVNWDDANSITKFYRQFVKPSLSDILDEYRYNNMLSSPRTHLRNIFSNLTQTFVTRPLTIMVEGKPVEAGKYFGGAAKSLPQAFDDAIASFRGKTPMVKPDLERIGTGKLPGFMTIPTRTMEAADRFFTALIKGGEIARGIAPEAAGKAAEYSLFRGGLRPEGQGGVLNAVDSLTAWTYKAPKAVRWFVPFVRTPMNFTKQWIEYSPAGVSTMIGAKNPREQLAKAMIGSMATGMGAYFALQGKTTWEAPTNPKEKAAFYASGRKPFSMQIGDKWVPMIYAGPMAFAVAFPAAMKYYNEQAPDALTSSEVEKATKISMSMARYLSGQTFLEGIENFVKMVSGDTDYSLGQNLAFTAGQLIPMQALVRYINTIVDPIYRKASGPVEAFKKDIPGLSKDLPAYTTPAGEESRRDPMNYALPFDIGTSDKSAEADYQGISELGQQRRVYNIETGEEKTRLQGIVEQIDAAKTNEEKKNILLQNIKTEDELKEVLNTMKQKGLGLTPLEKSLSGQPLKVRADYIKKQIQSMDREQKKQYLLNLAKKKILTEDTLKLIIAQ